MSRRFPASFTAALLATIAFAAPTACAATSGVPIPDPAFGAPSGIVRVGFDVVANGSDSAKAALIADGKLLLAGTVQTSVSQYDIGFARLDAATGVADAAFGGNGNGRALAGLAPIYPFAPVDLARTSDGRLLYLAQTPGPTAVAVVGRLNNDGTVDTSFNGNGRRFLGGGFFVDGGTGAQLSRVLSLPDGKVLVLGIAIDSSTGHACQAVARLLASGGIDSGFGAGRGSVCVAPALSSGRGEGWALDGTTLADGRILLAGAATHSGGSGYDMSVTRLLPDGQLDTSFGPGHDGWAFVGFDQGGTLNDLAFALAVDSTGRIAIAGAIEKQVGYDIAAARLLPSGAADATFGLDGRGALLGLDMGGIDPTTTNVYALAGGRVLVGGQSYENGAALAAMYTATGQLDPRFGDGGLFLQAASDAPSSTIVVGNRLLLAGDHLYMVGDATDPAHANNRDFAATRYVLPLFRDGFE